MAQTRPSTPPRTTKDLDRPWELGDAIPAPEAVHRDGDSAWALFTELSRVQEQRFADTAPMTLPATSREEAGWAATQPAARGLPLGLLPMTRGRGQPLFTLESAMLVARRNNRVCPRPEHWAAFCALLPARKTLRGLQPPPAAPTGAAWAVTPPLTKRMCFREQIEWAEQAGVLENVMAFMQSMSENEWLHMGED
jgi:hypothetical protein